MLPLLFTCLCATGLRGQSALWGGLAVEKEVNQRWAYQGELEWRRELTKGTAPTYLINFNTSWEAFRGGSITPGIRYGVGGDGQGGEIRVLSDLNYGKSLGASPFGYAARIRLQRDFLLDEPGAKTAFRLRPGLNYRPGKAWKVSLESELRYRFDLADLNRMRYTIAVDYDFSAALSIDVFFRREDRYAAGSLLRSKNIIGVYLAYHLPAGKQDKFSPRRPFGRQYN